MVIVVPWGGVWRSGEPRGIDSTVFHKIIDVVEQRQIISPAKWTHLDVCTLSICL